MVSDEFEGVDLPPYPVEEEEHIVVDLPQPTEPVVAVEDHESDEQSQEESEVGEPCSSCRREVEEEEKALTCDTCSKWCHIDCGRVSPEAYEYLIEHAADVRWMCPSCIQHAVDPTTEPHVAVRPVPE